MPVRHTGHQAGHLVSMGALIEVDRLDLKTLRVNTGWLVSVHPAMSTSHLIIELNAVLWRALSRALSSSRRPLSQVSHLNLGCLDPALQYCSTAVAEDPVTVTMWYHVMI